LSGKTVKPFECRVVTNNDETIWFEVFPGLLRKNNEIYAIQLICRDITEHKRAEEDMKKRLMKFRMEMGSIYLVKEPISALSLEALKDLIKLGYNGLVISRTPEEELKRVIKGNFEFVWMGEVTKGKDTARELNDIEERIENLPESSVVLIDRLDYLFFKNGFKKTLDFIQRLKDISHVYQLIVILSIDPGTLNRRELRLLEKETSEIEPLSKIKLSESLLEVLRFIYSQNNRGIRPIYSEICKELGISKPTTRNRIKLLISGGYVKEDVRGRNKFVELTEKGWHMFLEK
jgi:DNA-binding MarR family transcriptional regulator